MAQQLSARIIQGEDIQENKKANKLKQKAICNNTVNAFIEQHYKPWVIAKHKQSQKTLNSLKFNFGFLYSYPLDKIDILTIEKWCHESLQQGKKASSVNRNLVALKSLLAKAVEWGQLDKHPPRINLLREWIYSWG